jgi:hypothetical protein|tara:strand:- start:324 stop:575 length:252 start_codon:yes stop_codon:yes gene_type:complete
VKEEERGEMIFARKRREKKEGKLQHKKFLYSFFLAVRGIIIIKSSSSSLFISLQRTKRKKKKSKRTLRISPLFTLFRNKGGFE